MHGKLLWQYPQLRLNLVYILCLVFGKSVVRRAGWGVRNFTFICFAQLLLMCYEACVCTKYTSHILLCVGTISIVRMQRRYSPFANGWPLQPHSTFLFLFLVALSFALFPLYLFLFVLFLCSCSIFTLSHHLYNLNEIHNQIKKPEANEYR